MANGMAEIMQEIHGLRGDIAKDLGGMLRDLETLRSALGSKLAEQTNVLPIPTRQTYVAEYRDDTGQSRIAVVRTVTRHADGSFNFFTAHGDVLALRPSQLEGWEPILQRDKEPLPDGWWR